MRTKEAVLNELQRWGNIYKRKLEAEENLLQIAKQCTEIRRKSVESFKGWVDGTISVPEKSDREETLAQIDELARRVTDLRYKLVELYNYLADWEAMLSSLPSKHQLLLELMYRDCNSFEQVCTKMDISKVQALKIQRQSINLLRSIESNSI